MTTELLKLLGTVSPALIALVGVIVGGLITAAIERQKMNREADRHILKEAVSVMQGARLLSNELLEGMAYLQTAKDDPNYPLDAADLQCPSWPKYEAALTTYLLQAELENVLQALYAITKARQVDINGPSTTPADRQLLLGALFLPIVLAREALSKYADLPTGIQAVRQIHVPVSLWRRIIRKASALLDRPERSLT